MTDISEQSEPIEWLREWAEEIKERAVAGQAKTHVEALLEAYESLRTERDRLAADRKRAPHGVDCWLLEDPDKGVLPEHRSCTCWKSSAPSEALAEVKREVWDEGAQAVRDRMEEYGDRAMDDPENPYETLLDGS